MSSASDASIATGRAASVAVRRIDAARDAIARLADHAATIDRIGNSIADRLARGGTVYTAGNGGSAAEAMHLAEELVGRYRTNRRPYRAVSLVADPTALSCIANDFGFEEIFARPCEAFLGPGDVLVLFSTSGRSENIVRAARVARRKGSLVIGLLGGDGGDAVGQCHESVVVVAADSAATQEAHQVILHAICERLESTDAAAPPRT